MVTLPKAKQKSHLKRCRRVQCNEKDCRNQENSIELMRLCSSCCYFYKLNVYFDEINLKCENNVTDRFVSFEPCDISRGYNKIAIDASIQFMAPINCNLIYTENIVLHKFLEDCYHDVQTHSL